MALNLKKLEKKLDKALENETDASLIEWFITKRKGENNMPVICVNCNKKMSFTKSGVHVLETYEDGIRPYKVWSADYYECGCGNEVVTRFGQNPLKQEFDEDFENYVLRCKIKFK